MGIERRVDFLGIPVKTSRPVPGFQERMGRTWFSKSFVTLNSGSSIVLSRGEWNSVNPIIKTNHGDYIDNMASGYEFKPTQTVTLTDETINKFDVRSTRRWNGTRVSYRYVPDNK